MNSARLAGGSGVMTAQLAMNSTFMMRSPVGWMTSGFAQRSHGLQLLLEHGALPVDHIAGGARRDDEREHERAARAVGNHAREQAAVLVPGEVVDRPRLGRRPDPH